MSKYVAALYAGNRIVTGMNHGDAFSKLQEQEKDGEIESGFLDPETGNFFTEQYNFYYKQIYLIRHGQAEGQDFNANLTDIGQEQCKKCGEFLVEQEIQEYNIYCSPLSRCIQTAQILSKITSLSFQIENNLRKQEDDESDESFLTRINYTLEQIPTKCLLISHSDFIIQFIQKALGPQFVSEIALKNCAVTFIDARKIIHLTSKQN